MPDAFEVYRARVRNLLEQEIADLEVMRTQCAAHPTGAMQAMAGVCKWTRERVELLSVRVRLLEHDPDIRSAR